MTTDRNTPDGSLLLRTVDGKADRFSLDALQWGADMNLAEGWSVKLTLLAGQSAQVVNDLDGEKGAICYPEAQLIWTGTSDTFRLGRMWTGMGMELMDHTQDITASRGLLFTYALPFSQIGVNWHHGWNSSWSTDVWIFNGEDQIQDNNHGKTIGLGLNYNHGGATDKFVALSAYRGAEQNGLGSNENTGAEGRKRERLSMSGQWVWGASTLQWEAEYGREPFTAAVIAKSNGTADVLAHWSGAGVIYKWQFDSRWAAFLRAEMLKDDSGIRLNYDSTIAASYAFLQNADLSARSWALGGERRWANTFSRLEVREDLLNKDLKSSDSSGQGTFRKAFSMTWSFGSSF